jgi:hypothetical protein
MCEKELSFSGGKGNKKTNTVPVFYEYSQNRAHQLEKIAHFILFFNRNR